MTTRSFTAVFRQPGSAYRGAPFWAWNGKLEPAELRAQINDFRRMGLGGFFMHSRVGLSTKYLGRQWFDCVKACIDEAEKLGMQAWLYDEDRWPSGFAGGLVTRNPRYRMRHLLMERLVDEGVFRWDRDIIAAFRVALDSRDCLLAMERLRRGQKPSPLAAGELLLSFRSCVNPCTPGYNGYTYVDTLNPAAIKAFIRVTHKAYLKHAGAAFGRTVPGIFTDEPNYGRIFHGRPGIFPADSLLGKLAVAIPWTPRLPEIFGESRRYDLIDRLPEVFYNRPGARVSLTRYHYIDCITGLFVDAFARQVGSWCEAHGIAFTGHVLGEGSCSSQTASVGSALRFYRHMQAPGMDLLTEHKREYDTAKQVASVARQFGRKTRLSETYGCTGWDFTFEGHKALGDWQAALGINLRSQHLAWYTMRGQAKRDYPAAVSYQSPWWQSYHKVENYFARTNALISRGSEVRDLLVIHAIESQWAIHSIRYKGTSSASSVDLMQIRLRDQLLSRHLDFDYGDEYILARHGGIERKGTGAVLTVGRADYNAVLVPPLVTIRSSTLDLLRRFHAAGGLVVFSGLPPRHVDARPSDAASVLAALCPKAPANDAEALAALLEAKCRRVSIADPRGAEIPVILYHLSEDRDAFYLFTCNTGQARLCRTNYEPAMVRDRRMEFPAVTITAFRACRGRPLELDPDTGAIFKAASRITEKGWRISTSYPKLGSRLFMCSKNLSRTFYPARKALLDTRTTILNRKRWDIALAEPNVLPLDSPRYRIGGGHWHGSAPILNVDRLIRERLGAKPRGGGGPQPWAQKRPAYLPRITVELAYRIEIATVPRGRLLLGLERPETFEILLNGKPVANGSETGWWCDRSLRTIPLDPAQLHPGVNEIKLTCEYDETHSGLEIVYLLGDFGTRVCRKSVLVVASPDSLRIGDWCGQGLAFYGGNLTYRTAIAAVRRPGVSLFVQLPQYRGVGARILVDGKLAGITAWAPNEVEITNLLGAGPSILSIEILGHRRNSHGPLHYSRKWPTWTGPAQFGFTPGKWKEGYQLVPCGLLKAPRLIARRAIDRGGRRKLLQST